MLDVTRDRTRLLELSHTVRLRVEQIGMGPDARFKAHLHIGANKVECESDTTTDAVAQALQVMGYNLRVTEEIALKRAPA